MIRSIRGVPPLIPCALCGALCCATLPARAQQNPDAHEHGAASLDVVLDGNQLLIDLDSPADNVLGFEHAPSTDEQRATLESARESLGSETLFTPDAAAGCTLSEVDVDLPFGNDGHGEEHEDEHAHDEDHADEHDDEHDGDHVEEHGEEHGEDHAESHGEDHAESHGDEQHEAHSDVRVAYTYACEQPAQLSSIDTTLFDRFDAFERVAVQLAGPGGQSQLDLTGANPLIPLDAIR